ncbi:MAG: CpsD/CapB family tyrosine-protein kinase [Isosphaeraceae bacterium]
MREVDEALARAYAQREKGDSPQGVPPAPHWPAHVSRRGTPQDPAFGSGSIQAGPVASEAGPGPVAELQWPSVVLTLEREWGDRFERMAEFLIQCRERQNIRVILFTSCHRAEGRTTLVLTLARALSRHPCRTVLVDADLTGPMLARLLGIRPEVGLDDVIEDGRALSDALIDAPDDHLSLLPMRGAVARPREFLAGSAWTCSLARLRREFDLILLDGGPMFTGLSAAVLHRSVDAAVLVHHRGFTSERAILRAREVLEAGGVPLLGLAETFV